MSTFSQRNFSAGEIHPALRCKVDQVKHATGLAAARNVNVMRHGGIRNRPGSTFVCEVKDSTKTVRLIEFIYSPSQTYVLEFGNGYMRVILNGALVLEPAKAVTAITQANPGVFTVVGHGFLTGEELVFTSVSSNLNTLLTRNYKIVVLSADTFSLTLMNGTTPVDTTALNTSVFVANVARVYTVTTAIAESELAGLRFAQSSDLLIVVSAKDTLPPAPYKVTRTGHAAWTIATITLGPTALPPTAFTTTAAGTAEQYKVTSVSSTGDESLALYGTTLNQTSTIGWTAPSPAPVEYRIYRLFRGFYGLIGKSQGLTFLDASITPDTLYSPPTTQLFVSAGAVAFYQQRLVFGNVDLVPETIKASAIGSIYNFNKTTPSTIASSPVTFSMVGSQSNKVKHLLSLGKLLVFAEGSETVIQGDQDGALTPASLPNPKQISTHGICDLRPLVVDASPIYVQAQGSVVRDLAFQVQTDSYQGNELSIFSSHLVDGYTINDWAYQKAPYSIVWAVRSDGALVSFTYVREQQIIGWSRHDTDGTYENVCAIPEGKETALYAVVKRTINGVSKRYIERTDTRTITPTTNVADTNFTDCSLAYDGTNLDITATVTLSGGSTWGYDEALTLTASQSIFAATDTDKAIHITSSKGEILRCRISAYTSPTVITVFPHKTVSVAMRGVAFSTWAKAVKIVGGLWHIEGKKVSVFADGFVVASPNNSQAALTMTVTSGQITLDRCYGKIRVGLPYISDVKTLDIDTGTSETLSDKKILINKLTLHVQDTRGLFVGGEAPSNDSVDPLQGLVEIKAREFETYDEPNDLATGKFDQVLEGNWHSNGAIFIRQVDPVPFQISAIMPAGSVPIRRGI